MRAPWRLLPMLAAWAAVAGGPQVAAQPAPYRVSSPAADSSPPPPPRDVRLYVGMTTLHLEDVGGGLSNDRLVAVSWGRYYAASYINTYGVRSWSAGVQGEFRRWGAPRAGLSVGYRAGLLTGYDERFLAVAGRVPVLPLLQPLLTLQHPRAGVELSWSGVVTSLGVFVRP